MDLASVRDDDCQSCELFDPAEVWNSLSCRNFRKASLLQMVVEGLFQVETLELAAILRRQVCARSKEVVYENSVAV